MEFCVYPAQAGHNGFFEELMRRRTAANLAYCRPTRHDGSIIVYHDIPVENQQLMREVAHDFGWGTSDVLPVENK